ncbi:MAG: universal stress protein [Ilumatobacter sp.]|uniref:universal stress protein n=1 Tax=Ilumatobacter sp. TaxID=1967498 RepID=UPI002623C1BA|nr:universal stress protein [Ilumatobacter sp.]MDJ0768619.1 universal stress protein [Ilumatobacter sp.]
MSKVLVAIDGSDHSTKALIEAVHLFGGSADYVLASVVPSPSIFSAFGAMAADELGTGIAAGTATHGTSTGSMPFAPTPEGVTALQEQAYDYYRTVQDQAATTAGISAERIIEEAKPRKRRIGRAICDIAEEQSADLIVVGSHGSSYAGETMLGSVSQYVLHNASCPVLVAREND